MGVFNFFNRVKPEKNIGGLRRTFGVSGGTIVNGDTAMESSAFYRGVVYISTQIAKLPWEVKDSKNNVIEDNVSYLLNVAPNNETTSMMLKIYLIQCAIIEGNGYAEIERTIDGRPIALWPLNPRRVRPVRSGDGKLYYEVMEDEGNNTYLTTKDIFIVRNLHTKDSIQGQGIIGYAMQTLGISIGADKFANSLFANGGMPSGVLTHPGKLSDEAYKRLKDSWKDQQGGKKTGGTALLEDGVLYNPISHAPDVLQFLESRQFSVLEIARFLGIPATKLFDSGSAKFNNIEHANLEVATDTLDTWARNLESEADIKLLNGRRMGRRTEFDLYAVFRGDMVTRSTYFKNMMSVGAMSPNEIREKEGMSGYDGGDKFYIATNNYTNQEKIDAITDAQIEKTHSEIRKNDASISQEKEKPKEDPVDKALVAYLESKVKPQN